MAATDTESMQDNMTRLRMRMVQQKLANERERLQRPGSSSSDNDDSQLKLQQAMLRRQELLDRIRQEQIADDQRPRTYSPRRRYTPSPLPPPSRRSLPDLSRAYHFNWYNKDPAREPQEVETLEGPRYAQGRPLSYPVTQTIRYELPPLSYQQPPRRVTRTADMAQTKHVIEHQFRPSDQPVHTYRLPPIQPVQAIQPAVPQLATIQTPQPVIQSLPSVAVMDGSYKPKDTMFNKADFMDMMMLQNAQMHHMVMQQMMLQNLPNGGGRLPTAQVPLAPIMAEAAPMMRAPMSYAPPVVHHYAPPLEMRAPPGRGMRRVAAPQKPALGPPIGHRAERHDLPVYLYGTPGQKDKQRDDKQEEARRDATRFHAARDTRDASYMRRRQVRSSGDRGHYHYNNNHHRHPRRERRSRWVEGPALKRPLDDYRSPFRRSRSLVQGPPLRVQHSDAHLRPQGRYLRTPPTPYRARPFYPRDGPGHERGGRALGYYDDPRRLGDTRRYHPEPGRYSYGDWRYGR